LSSLAFPKAVRILRRSDFRKVYDEGVRFSCPYFAAFCLKRDDQEIGPKVGFTVTKATGKSVRRNRMKRRLREAVRLSLSALPTPWLVVFNCRKALLEGEFPSIQREVERLFARCANA
jgi:ribonuclease P protein component